MPDRAHRIVTAAISHLGAPYLWGGSSPRGFDCSGFVWYVCRAAGVPVPRNLWGQLHSGARVSRDRLAPGDLVFFAGTYESGLSHGGIYLGDGRFVHAEDYGLGVRISSLAHGYWRAHFYGACRR